MDIKKVYETEVVICGGGPSGMSCAYALGKKGIKTIVIDKKTHERIGDKVCGDAYNPEFSDLAYAQIGLPKPNEDNNELMEHLDFINISGSTDRSNLHILSSSATVDRLRYGQALLKAVEEFESVTVIDSTKLRSVITKDNTVMGIVVKREFDITIHAKVVVDASGSYGSVRAKLPDSMCTKFMRKTKTEEMLVAYREIIRTKNPHNFQRGMYLIYEKELDDVMPGYYWVFSRGVHEVNIGLGYYKRPENMGKNIREMNTKIRDKYFEDFEVLDARGDSIPARLPLPSMVHNGFITIGDAGAMVNPLNGEGHAPAIFSGIQAGRVIIDALEKDDLSEEKLWNYNIWAWNSYGSLHSIGVAMICFLDKYGFDAFDWLLANKIIEGKDIIAQLEDPSPRFAHSLVKFLKLIRKPRILFGLLKMLTYSKKLQEHSRNYPLIEEFEEWNNKLGKLLKTKF